jgi:hypothetical protein
MWLLGLTLITRCTLCLVDTFPVTRVANGKSQESVYHPNAAANLYLLSLRPAYESAMVSHTPVSVLLMQYACVSREY